MDRTLIDFIAKPNADGRPDFNPSAVWFSQKTTNMQRLFILILLLTSFAGSLRAQDRNASTDIFWDTWGVPHIYAPNDEQLFYAFGWAQMQSHGNLILELYGKSRGKAASYWGEKYLQNDILVNTMGFPKLAEEWYEQQEGPWKKNYSAFVKGMNAYANAHLDSLDAGKRVVLPLEPKDVIQHYLFVIYADFVGGGDLGQAQRWGERGSNTWAIAPSKSENGHAMLVQNPHLPWEDEFLFYEAHLNTPGHNIYGATVVGFPTIGIGFNENLGWSHTNNTIDNSDLYELELTENGYMLDGAEKAFDSSTVQIEVKNSDGSKRMQDIQVLRSVQGPVIKKSGNKALAIRMPGYDRPFAAVEWWQMASASSFDEFETALKAVQIPFFNVMYADKAGNIFYLFNGQVPKRASGDLAFWHNIIPGNKSEYVWTDVHPYEDLPKIKNPEQGWLQNANDPPWTSTFPMKLDPKKFPPYMSPVEMGFRPQRSVRMLDEDKSITFDELVEYKLSTRMELADRILDDLFAAIDEKSSDLAKEAKTVLENWDREADNDSKGALLFYNWARKMRFWNQATFKTPWSLAEARTTPDGLADPAAAVKTLEEAANEIKTNYGSLDIPWGDVYRIQYNGLDLPGNGADGSVGVFRVAWPGGMENGKMKIGGGDSWVSVIEFGDKVRAKVLLSYGNSTQRKSPHNGDQLKLFSEKQLRDAWIYREDVVRHMEKSETLGKVPKD